MKAYDVMKMLTIITCILRNLFNTISQECIWAFRKKNQRIRLKLIIEAIYKKVSLLIYIQEEIPSCVYLYRCLLHCLHKNNLYATVERDRKKTIPKRILLNKKDVSLTAAHRFLCFYVKRITLKLI